MSFELEERNSSLSGLRSFDSVVLRETLIPDTGLILKTFPCSNFQESRSKSLSFRVQPWIVKTSENFIVI